MTPTKPAPRRLQQQPARFSDLQQQRSGSTDFQPMLGWTADVGGREASDLERAGREARARYAVGPQLPASRLASALLG